MLSAHKGLIDLQLMVPMTAFIEDCLPGKGEIFIDIPGIFANQELDQNQLGFSSGE
jgi:hypothetical protein